VTRLLIAEDDAALRLALTTVLEGAGYEVVTVGDGLDAARLGTTEPFALVILDVDMPGIDGLEACRRIRAARADVAILLLTGHGSEADVVAGLDAGADDYVTKPFRVGELLARVRANVRRAVREAHVAGDVRVDPEARRAWHGGHEVQLTPREFDLLEVLIANAGRTVTRERLVALLWGEWYGSPKALDMHLAGLRRKLDEAGGPHDHITTVRGVGLRFEP
jgi:DNA-binding response OmpR family regulator